MTYADRDWSGGASYKKLGFNAVSILEPQFFQLSENLTRTLVKTESDGNTVLVFNTGSIKFILNF